MKNYFSENKIKPLLKTQEKDFHRVKDLVVNDFPNKRKPDIGEKLEPYLKIREDLTLNSYVF